MVSSRRDQPVGHLGRVASFAWDMHVSEADDSEGMAVLCF